MRYASDIKRTNLGRRYRLNRSAQVCPMIHQFTLLYVYVSSSVYSGVILCSNNIS